MPPKVSVVVPVYNVERYIHQCVDSLINQTLKDIEIILVDDGSPDGCGAICDAYAKQDARIRVVHKANGGLASARQAGLELVKGLYCIACDSDDWVDLDMYETLYNKAILEDADMVVCGYMANYPDGREVINPTYNFTTMERYIKDVLTRRADQSSCIRLIRSDVFKNYGVDYQEGVNLGEDALLLCKLLKYPLKLSFVDRPLYHYRRDMSSGSYTNNISLSSIEQLKFVEQWKWENYCGREYVKERIESTVNLCFAAIRANGMTKEYYKSFASQLSIYKMVRHGVLSAKSLFIIISKVCGFRVARFIFGKLYPLLYK